MSSTPSQPSQVTCTDIEGNTYQVPASELVFRPAVYGVVIEDNKLLLSKQWDGYDFPGGGIELGETTELAIEREVREETGIEVEVGKILHCQHSFFKLPFKGTFVHSIHMFYLCHKVGGELSTDNFDVHEQEYADMPEWVSLDQVLDQKFYSSADVRTIMDSIPH